MAKQQLPGDGFLGWLGRQVGHVKKAVTTKVIPPAEQGGRAAGQQGGAGPAPGGPGAPPGEEQKQIVYRQEQAEEVEMPDKPGVVLRRTIIDEVIVDPGQAKDEESRQ